MEGTIGEIRMFAGNFAPREWAFCQGQLLSIPQNTALFSIIGTMYGGDGRTTFGLPDLRGRVPVGQGQGPGLHPYRLGEKGGQESVTLTVANMPMHSHGATVSGGGVSVKVSDGLGDTAGAFGSVLAKVAYETDLKKSVEVYQKIDTATFAEGNTLGGITYTDPTVTIQNAGASQSVNNIQPFLAINFVICVHGMFPSRN